MTPLPLLLSRLADLESQHAQIAVSLKAGRDAFYSSQQLRVFYHRRIKLSRQIKQLKADIQLHPDYHE